jgi:creatinine amidohydrolase
MTVFFQYDTLTWPAVAVLPRDTPLILPLGEGYAFDRLSSALGEPLRAGLLPPFPFGWQGSGLVVPEAILGATLANLLDSLREDGFTRVYALTPQGIDLGLGASRIALPRGTGNVTVLSSVGAGECGGGQQPPDHASESAPTQHTQIFGFYEEIGGKEPHTIPYDSERGKVVLLPIGHTEQHGYHLPLSVDTLIIEAIGQGTASAASEQACCLPVMPYGVSTHRKAFAGTLNSGGRAFEDFWVAVIDGLAGRGFDRFYFLSGHGGNMSFLVNVVKYTGERHRRIFCATSFLYLSGPEGVAALQAHRRSPHGGMGHACELETALILHLRPDLVQMDKAVDEMDFIATPSYSMDWIESGALIANPPWDDDTLTGAYGAGSLATAEHGQIWLKAAIAEKITHVAEIHEQHQKREARRRAGFGLWGKV